MNHAVATKVAFPFMALAIALGTSGQPANGQALNVTTSQPNGFTTITNVKACGIPGAPFDGCVAGTFQSPPGADMSYVVAGELADVRQLL